MACGTRGCLGARAGRGAAASEHIHPAPARAKPPPALAAWVSTDVTLRVHDLLHEYDDRWAVDIAIRDTNAFDGLGREQGRKRHRIVGAHPFRVGMAAARTLWFLDQVACGTLGNLCYDRPW